MPFTSRVPWREKMNRPDEPRVVANPRGGTMLIPTPRLVDAEMRRVRKGRVITVREIRERLAAAHQTDTACPLTTGIFLRIAAEAAEEEFRSGKSRITPYWRVVRDDGSLNEKFPGGAAAQARRLRAEGHRVERRGTRWQVAR
jgi:hypothetical protein